MDSIKVNVNTKNNVLTPRDRVYNVLYVIDTDYPQYQLDNVVGRTVGMYIGDMVLYFKNNSMLGYDRIETADRKKYKIVRKLLPEESVILRNEGN